MAKWRPGLFRKLGRQTKFKSLGRDKYRSVQGDQPVTNVKLWIEVPATVGTHLKGGELLFAGLFHIDLSATLAPASDPDGGPNA